MTEPTNLIFVVGASRSGTTVLSGALNMHSQLAALTESHYFGAVASPRSLQKKLSAPQAKKILASLFATQRSSIFDPVNTAADQELVDDILDREQIVDYASLFLTFSKHIARENHAIIPVEQTPKNIFYAKQLLDAYPNCRIVEIVRDPRAVICSQRMRWRMRFSGSKYIPIARSIAVALNYHAVTMSYLWRTTIKAGRQMHAHPRFVSVRYEDLVTEPEATLRKICSFADIEFQEKMLLAPNTTSSTRQITRKNSGFYASAQSTWREKLPRGDLAFCERITQKQALHYGYTFSPRKADFLFMVWHALRYPLHIVGVVCMNPRNALLQVKSLLGRHR